MVAVIEVALRSRRELDAGGPDAALNGPIGRDWRARALHLPAGESHRGHYHEIDHVTVVWSGTVRVQRSDRATPTEWTAPGFIDMPAHVKHTITALTDAVVSCLFRRPAGFSGPFDAEMT